MRRMLAVMLLPVVVVTQTPAAADSPADEFSALLRSVEELDRRVEACVADPKCLAAEADAAEAAAAERAHAARAAAAEQKETRDQAAAKLGRVPGIIKLGDTHEYVEQQWSRPDRIDTMLSAFGTHTWWWWDSGLQSVHFINGRVDSIHQQTR